MFTYAYSIAVYLGSDTRNPHTTLSGQVEAERYSHACGKAWPLIHAECERIQSETGQSTGVGSLSVRMLAQCFDCREWFYADDAVWYGGHPHCTDCAQDAA